MNPNLTPEETSYLEKLLNNQSREIPSLVSLPIFSCCLAGFSLSEQLSTRYCRNSRARELQCSQRLDPGRANRTRTTGDNPVPKHPFGTVYFLCLLLLPSCTDMGTAPDHGLLADHSGITDPELRWEAYAIQDYAILQARTCFCVDGGKKFLVTVRSGIIESVVDPTDGSVLAADRWGGFKTIPDLFALAKSIDTTTVASLQVSYDPRYGYPLRVFVDPSAQIADEEYGFETTIIH